MNTVIATAGKGYFTPYAKRLVAGGMLERGQWFFAAALLLRQTGNRAEGKDYVFLYLLCQALEVVLKALLLFAGYDTFRSQLAMRKLFGHDLLKLADQVCLSYQQKSLTTAVRTELSVLNTLYKDDPLLLRYASMVDIFRTTDGIESDVVCRRMGALIRLVQRELRR